MWFGQPSKQFYQSLTYVHYCTDSEWGGVGTCILCTILIILVSCHPVTDFNHLRRLTVGYKDDRAPSVGIRQNSVEIASQVFKMRSLVILCAFFAVFYGVQATGAFFRFGFGTGGRRTDPDTRAGESCTPRYMRRCGEPRLVEETVRPADDSG